MWPCRTLEGLNEKMCELLHTSTVVQKMQRGLPLFWRRGAALSWPGVLAGMASPRMDRLNCSGSGFAIRGALRPYIEFIPDAWHREDESRRLRVRLYLATQAGDEHIDAAVIGFRATPGNGVTELVTRQDPARTVYEGGQQRDLGTGQPHFPAAAMDKGMPGQVELAVLDFYRRWDGFIALAPWRRR